ncbi:BRO-N domain-containing protein [Paramaledivibacter caminithermalis]|jgi:prophage antirepressor-like protein|uniref:Prophage antirepressor n=1 Tax=Paramaledivibacter caminithermalis (strain DSM 15212 / CIP 107654 / DViRD3) TaxID=1121301 RepID=A0A1M6M247_PARC5|nr:BRO family protein [Paramaledivibacter caminithermalis]SHJ77519.1 Prophage antirepressor [Paramaledivibacter caminithermalis DSM 15212]
MNEVVKVFKNKDFGEVRSMIINNEPWFVGKDVAEVLAYKEPHKAISRHVDEDDGMKHPIIDNLGRVQEVIVINESGLYALILSSKLSKAKQFKRWITKEVLPTLRKTGSYSIDRKEPSLSEIIRFLRFIKDIMKSQNCSDRSIAVTVKNICQQFQIQLPEEFLKLTDLEERFLQFLYTDEFAYQMTSGDAVQVFLGRKINEISEETYQRLKNIYYETALKEGWSE